MLPFPLATMIEQTMETAAGAPRAAHELCDKGKPIGHINEIRTVRTQLRMARHIRELALFDLAIARPSRTTFSPAVRKAAGLRRSAGDAWVKAAGNGYSPRPAVTARVFDSTRPGAERIRVLPDSRSAMGRSLKSIRGAIPQRIQS